MNWRKRLTILSTTMASSKIPGTVRNYCFQRELNKVSKITQRGEKMDWMPKISLNSLFGIYCDGIFPSILKSSYNGLLKTAIDTRTPIEGKSFTYPKWNGNFHIWWPWTWKYIQRIHKNGEIISPYEFWKFFGTRNKMGLLNSYNHTGPGAKKSIERIGKSSKKGIWAIPNFFPDLSKNIYVLVLQFTDVINQLKLTMGGKFSKIELAMYCPNRQEDTNKDIDKAMEKSLMFLRLIAPNAKRKGVDIIAKVGFLHTYDFCQEAELIGVKAIHAINAVPFSIVYGDSQRSPLQKVGGGAVSGKIIKKLGNDYFSGLRKKVNLWLIKGGGIMDKDDVTESLDMGADTVTSCTGPDLFPERWEKILLEFNT
ncbi:MAG: hypothetical protein V1804_03805 [Patescibacteria group bacterium]